MEVRICLILRSGYPHVEWYMVIVENITFNGMSVCKCYDFVYIFFRIKWQWYSVTTSKAISTQRIIRYRGKLTPQNVLIVYCMCGLWTVELLYVWVQLGLMEEHSAGWLFNNNNTLRYVFVSPDRNKFTAERTEITKYLDNWYENIFPVWCKNN